MTAKLAFENTGKFMKFVRLLCYPESTGVIEAEVDVVSIRRGFCCVPWFRK